MYELRDGIFITEDTRKIDNDIFFLKQLKIVNTLMV